MRPHAGSCLYMLQALCWTLTLLFLHEVRAHFLFYFLLYIQRIEFQILHKFVIICQFNLCIVDLVIISELSKAVIKFILVFYPIGLDWTKIYYSIPGPVIDNYWAQNDSTICTSLWLLLQDI